jgi:hypothetical protein
MNKIFLLFIVISAIVSCKKDSVTTPPISASPVIAPCTIGESFYGLDSVYYNSNAYQQEAKFRVRFVDTLNSGQTGGELEFFFNKIPTSGIYQMVAYIDTNNLNIPNQIAYIADSGSFMVRSQVAELSKIYVENNANEIIISWCSLPDTTFYFDSATSSFVGNSPSKRKIRKSY